jgi:hypothetical protein
MRSLPKLAAATLIALVTVVGVADAAKTSRYGTSFVDVDNDGVFDAGSDILLSSILGPDDTDFDTDVARAGYTPPGGPAGVVFEGKVTLVGWGAIQASGTITVRGHLVALPSEPDDITSLDVEAPVIDIAPRAKVTKKNGYQLYMIADLLRIGDRARITTVDSLWLGAYDFMVIGENVQIRSTGNPEDYEPLVFILASDLQAGEGLYVRGNEWADCLIEHNPDTHTDLVLRRFRARCGYIELASYGPRLHLFDSYLDSRNPEGFIELYLDPGPDGGYPPDALIVENTSIRSLGGFQSTPPLP